MIRPMIAALAIGLAGPVQADPSDGLTGAEAQALIAAAMSAAHVTGTAQIAAARPLPACAHPPTVSPAAPRDWRSVDLRCTAPDWVRRVRTGAPLPSAAPALSATAGPGDLAASGAGTALALRESLSRGTVIEAHHLVAADAGSVPPPGLIDNAAALVGRRLAVHLGAGRLVLARHLDQSWLVETGNAVAIVSDGAGLSVTVAGEALENGQRGDRIQVRNTRSGRIIEAAVLSADRVTVAPNIN